MKNLNEISYIRPLLIVLLVFYHSFAPWCDAWRPFDGFCENELYWWLAKTAYSFMLPMFVFSSGYVWSFQRITLRKNDSFAELFQKKTKRLFVPSLIFSIAYVVLLSTELTDGNIVNVSLAVISGYAHMWFLPMLFWTFLLTWLLLQVKNVWLRWFIAIIGCIFSMFPFPLGIDKALYYMVYFLAGYETYANISYIKKYANMRCILLLCAIFVSLFIILTISNEVLIVYKDNSFITKALIILTTNVSTKLYGFAGLFALYYIALCYTNTHELPKSIIKLGAYCFGVYLFQQFILQELYYHTNLPLYVGNLWLPWIGFFITMVASLALSYITKLTKLGNKLI